MAFWQKDFLIHKSYKLSFLLSVLTIAASVITFYFIARVFGSGASTYLNAYGGEYFPFVLIGIAFSDFLFTGLNSFARALRNEQMRGTLGALLLTPVKTWQLLIGASIWDFTFSAFRVVVYLILGVTMFKVALNPTGLLTATVVLLLTAISFSCLGIMASAFIMIFKRGDPLTWAFTGVSALLGGVYYPVAVLPQGLQRLSAFLPITYSLRAVRLTLLSSSPLTAVWPDILALTLFSLLILPLSMTVFSYSLNKAKQDGTLLQY